MNDSMIARVAALKNSPVADLKQMWLEMFQREAPPFNRRFLETRLAYRIQELALGGLKRETIKRLEKLSEQFDEVKDESRRRRVDDRPLAGTRLIREWNGQPMRCSSTSAILSTQASATNRFPASPESLPEPTATAGPFLGFPAHEVLNERNRQSALRHIHTQIN